MSAVTTTKRFVRGRAPASRIQDVAREVLAELDDPASEASSAAQRAGLTRADLADARAEVAEAEHGADPFLTPIIIGIAVSAGSKVAETLWKDVLWPRIRLRLGADAIGKPANSAEET